MKSQEIIVAHIMECKDKKESIKSHNSHKVTSSILDSVMLASEAQVCLPKLILLTFKGDVTR